MILEEVYLKNVGNKTKKYPSGIRGPEGQKEA
jgi:hypothetical protein